MRPSFSRERPRSVTIVGASRSRDRISPRSPRAARPRPLPPSARGPGGQAAANWSGMSRRASMSGRDRPTTASSAGDGTSGARRVRERIAGDRGGAQGVEVDDHDGSHSRAGGAQSTAATATLPAPLFSGPVSGHRRPRRLEHPIGQLRLDVERGARAPRCPGARRATPPLSCSRHRAGPRESSTTCCSSMTKPSPSTKASLRTAWRRIGL